MKRTKYSHFIKAITNLTLSFSKWLAEEDEHKLQTEVSNNVLLNNNNSVFKYA